MEVCHVCENPAQLARVDEGSNITEIITCAVCGNYSADASLSYHLPDKKLDDVRWLFSGVLRQNSEENNPLFIKSLEFMEEAVENADKPKDPLAQIDRLLVHICRKNTVIGLGNSVPFNPDHDYPLAFAKDSGEFRMLMFSLAHMGLISGKKDGTSAQPRPDGWKRFRELQAQEVHSNQAFVAMSFSDELDDVWKKGIIPALEQLRFVVKFLKKEEHDGKIDDKIIAEIRKSGLVVADFTEQRQSVYFEAGFAEGLGRRVIRTCRAGSEKKLAFDTRNYNHIIWEDPADLKKKLINRIEAKPLPKSS